MQATYELSGRAALRTFLPQRFLSSAFDICWFSDIIGCAVPSRASSRRGWFLVCSRPRCSFSMPLMAISVCAASMSDYLRATSSQTRYPARAFRCRVASFRRDGSCALQAYLALSASHYAFPASWMPFSALPSATLPSLCSIFRWRLQTRALPGGEGREQAQGRVAAQENSGSSAIR